MSIWIRAICTKSIGPLREIDLRAALDDADIELWAEACDVDDADVEAACEKLRFEPVKHRTRDQILLHYRADDHYIVVERWTGKQAREEADEMLEMAEDADGDGVDRVRDVMSRAVETVAFDLKQSDANGMGWPIALLAAMELAKLGGGLVQGDTDGDTWWDPQTGEVVAEY